MTTDIELIKQAKAVIPEEWDSITEIIQQTEDGEIIADLLELQYKKMLEYEQGNKPKTRGSYKKKGDYKARSKTKQNRNWKQENIFNNNGIHD